MAKKAKNRYTVSNDNRLIIRRLGEVISVSGSFEIDRKNQLIYWLNEPSAWRKQYALPPKIVFKGSWRLNSNHDLQLILNKNRNQSQIEILTIKGNIISADTDILAFQAKSYSRDGLLHIRVLKLNITLFADQENRLCFEVKKAKPDVLVLTGNWQLNKSQQIVYEYYKAGLKRKDKVSHTLLFRGFWQISAKNRLTYILGHSSSSRFDFRAQLETPTIYPQKGVIKYRLGLGIREDKLSDKIITLYGVWKFSRGLGLTFEMDYYKAGLRSIEFGAEVAFKEDTVALSLKNEAGEPLGITLTLTHKFLKSQDTEAFLRLKALGKGSAIEAGAKITF